MVEIARHKSAMHRTGLSRPMALAVNEELIGPNTTIFDFGCGRGGDVERLRTAGLNVAGWDPRFAPEEPLRVSDVVNIGYVVNVIESARERVEALKKAWALAMRVLIVSARLDWEARYLTGRIHEDGLVTSKGTFQKLFSQEELADWIEGILGSKPIAAAPGIFYVFRSRPDAQSYLSRRYRSGITRISPTRADELYELHQASLEVLASFVLDRGRLPREDEIDCAKELKVGLGSIGRAFAVIRSVTGNDAWQVVAEKRRRDLLVFLALSRFDGRQKMSDLPAELQWDIRDLLGNHKAAVMESDRLLFAAGDREVVDTCARSAVVGKLTPEAIYVHGSAVAELPPILRIYEGCARAFAGTVQGGNIIKLHRQRAQVSYLSYPEFDREPHPELKQVMVVRLGKLQIDVRDYGSSENPLILHRKECFVGSEYPFREKFAKLTRQEEKAGLFESSQTIGTRLGWAAVLGSAGVRLSGHRLVRAL